jgi:hypothetical protein
VLRRHDAWTFEGKQGHDELPSESGSAGRERVTAPRRSGKCEIVRERVAPSIVVWRVAGLAAVVAVSVLGAGAVAQVHSRGSARPSDDSGSALRWLADGDASGEGGAEQRPAVATSAHALRSYLGRRAEDIQADAGPLLDGGAAWRPFQAGLFVQFRGDRVVRISAQLPVGTTCEAAAQRFGFDRAMPPLRRANACEWPARSERHLIEPGVAGRMDLRTGAFEVWVAE